jgi:hypothetical protein
VNLVGRVVREGAKDEEAAAVAGNEEAGASEARIKREEGGEFVFFLSPFLLSHTRSSAPNVPLSDYCTSRTQSSRSHSPTAMAQDAGDAVLLASRITMDRHLSLVHKFMPEGAVVRARESRPRPRYLDRSVHLLSFAMVGLIPPFYNFFHEVLDFYRIHALHLASDDTGPTKTSSPPPSCHLFFFKKFSCCSLR